MDEGGAGMGVNIASSKQVHTQSVGCARPSAMFGRRIHNVGIFGVMSEAATMSIKLVTFFGGVQVLMPSSQEMPA